MHCGAKRHCEQEKLPIELMQTRSIRFLHVRVASWKLSSIYSVIFQRFIQDESLTLPVRQSDCARHAQ